MVFIHTSIKLEVPEVYSQSLNEKKKTILDITIA